jgi:hypothetical protein
MRRSVVPFVLCAVLVVCGAGAAWTQSKDVYNPAEQPSDVPASTEKVPIDQPHGGVLWDNGSLVTHPGVCPAGADASRLQTSLGLTVFGFTASTAGAFRIADNFTVPAPGWIVNEIVLYGYQTGSTTVSTFNTVHLQIWNGPPNGGGVVIFGDTTTNRYASSLWSNIYRDLDTTTCTAGGTTRPPMAVRATVPLTLPPGTYWVDFALGGTLASGPFVPPTSAVGQVNNCAHPPCNALQWSGTAWAAVVDGATPQEVKFVVEGVLAPVELMGFDVK